MGNIEVQDVGDCWRAINPRQITPTQTLKWVDAQGNDSGIRYTVGVDSVGQTGIAYADYPKTIWTQDDVATSDMVPKFFARCQICSAIDQIKQVRSSQALVPADESRTVPMQSSVAQMPVVGSSRFDEQMPPDERDYLRESRPRVSAADFLPKYVPVTLNLVKKLALSRLGDAAVSVVLSFAADAASTMSSDPKYQCAMRGLSDGLVDDLNVDESFLGDVQQDFTRLVDAYQRDGDLLSAMKKSMIRPPSGPAHQYPSVTLPGRSTSYSYQPKSLGSLTPSRAID